MTRISKIVKSRVLQTAVPLLDEKGYFGVRLNEILTLSKTSKASAYRQFPGGKEEIILFAIKDVQSKISTAMKDIFEREDDMVIALRASIEFLKQSLIDGSFATGCPIATVGLELSGSDSLTLDACMNAFQEWEDLLECYLSDHVPPEECKPLSSAIFCMFQGALVLSRITGDTVHLDNAGNYGIKLFLLNVR